jgi:hypothetical protein
MIAFYRQFSQGISVVGCSVTSFITLGWMMLDVHRLEKKQIRMEYDNKISNYEKEIHNLKQVLYEMEKKDQNEIK